MGRRLADSWTYLMARYSQAPCFPCYARRRVIYWPHLGALPGRRAKESERYDGNS